jgi:hypothetical protein
MRVECSQLQSGRRPWSILRRMTPALYLTGWAMGVSGCGSIPGLGSKDSGSGTAEVAAPIESVAFAYPKSTTIVKDRVITFRMEFTAFEPTATWSLFRTQKAGETTGGLDLASALPISQSTYDWDLSAVPDGTYHIYVRVVRADGSDRTLALANPVVVDRVIGENAPPSIGLAGLAAATVHNKASPIGFRFDAVDPDGDPITLALEYRRTPATEWTPIESNYTPPSESFDYPWTISSLDQGIYEFRIIATDLAGAVSAAAPAGQFGIVDSAVTYAGNIRPFLDQYCMSCHSPGNANTAAASRFLADDASVATPDIGLTARALNTGGGGIMNRMRRTGGGKMPPAGSPQPSAAEIDAFQLWIWGGRQ